MFPVLGINGFVTLPACSSSFDESNQLVENVHNNYLAMIMFFGLGFMTGISAIMHWWLVSEILPYRYA